LSWCTRRSVPRRKRISERATKRPGRERNSRPPYRCETAAVPRAFRDGGHLARHQPTNAPTGAAADRPASLYARNLRGSLLGNRNGVLSATHEARQPTLAPSY
jgi:hypothetical protein